MVTLRPTWKYRDTSCRGKPGTNEELCVVTGGNSAEAYLQYESGYALDIPTDPTQTKSLWQVSQDSSIDRHPCDMGQHSFTSTYSDVDRLEICGTCGYSIDSLTRYLGQDLLRNHLPFNCAACGERIADGPAGHVKEPMVEKVCSDCWLDEFLPQVGVVRDELDTHFVTCRHLLTSVAAARFPPAHSSEATCRWVAKAHPDLITDYFTIPDTLGMPDFPQAENACPYCGYDNRQGIVFASLDSLLGQALETTLTDGDISTTAALFEDGSVDRILTDDEHGELLDEYHDLERDEFDYIVGPDNDDGGD